jgi:hypothetical protein
MAMMQIPAPTPPLRERATYSNPPTHNVAAVVSLICAILWPLTGLIPMLWDVVTTSAPGPQWWQPIFSITFGALPYVAVIAGVVGLVRSFTQPQLRRSRWQAIIGLIFGLMWVVAQIFVFSFAGLGIIYWFRHLGG